MSDEWERMKTEAPGLYIQLNWLLFGFVVGMCFAVGVFLGCYFLFAE